MECIIPDCCPWCALGCLLVVKVASGSACDGIVMQVSLDPSGASADSELGPLNDSESQALQVGV